MDYSRKEILFINCARGVAPYLRGEVEQLGYPVESLSDTGIELKASLNDALRLNLCLRSGLHVLCLLKKFSCRSPEELYQEVKSFAWEELIAPEEYLSVISSTDTAYVNNSIFASQKTKDAIVDRLLAKYGKRPDSGPERDNLVINLYWKDDCCWLYLNTSGRKLSERTYRKIPYQAPLQESLAAALLLAAGYNGSTPLVNPMCGSGTLAIEAALIALGRAPGLLRSNFGLMHVKGFDQEGWQALRKQIHTQARKQTPFRIIASDIDQQAIAAARKNAQTAGVEQFIEFHRCDFSATPLPKEQGLIILNPEYGFRMGDQRALEQTYARIGDFFKNSCQGFTGYVFTGNMALAKQIKLRTSRRLTFFNARIECRLLGYQLYQGSKRQ